MADSKRAIIDGATTVAAAEAISYLSEESADNQHNPERETSNQRADGRRANHAVPPLYFVECPLT